MTKKWANQNLSGSTSKTLHLFDLKYYNIFKNHLFLFSIMGAYNTLRAQKSIKSIQNKEVIYSNTYLY